MNRVYRCLLIALAAQILEPALATAQEAQQRIDDVLRRAAQAEVPVTLLQSKVAEGRAKGVPLERIASAVEQRFEVLSRARTSFGQRTGLTPPELGLAADGLQAGVSEQALGAISESAPHARRAVAIATLTRLVQLGVASETALQQVTEALAQGDDALINLPARVANGRGRGGPPETVPGRGVAGDGGRGGPPSSVPGRGNANGRGRGGPPVP